MWINAVDGFKAVVTSASWDHRQPRWGYGCVPLPEHEHWAEIRQRSSSLIVLDDLGLRGRASDAQYDALQKFLLMRQDRPTVITSNLDLDRLAGVYDDRTASRIAAGTVVEIGGPDRRIDGCADA
jgi:DNA replication protein DnaC